MTHIKELIYIILYNMDNIIYVLIFKELTYICTYRPTISITDFIFYEAWATRNFKKGILDNQWFSQSIHSIFNGHECII